MLGWGNILNSSRLVKKAVFKMTYEKTAALLRVHTYENAFPSPW
jgi:hypothetical protein